MSQQQHERTKRILRIVGCVLMLVGAACSIVGLISMMRAMNGDGMPTLVILDFIGLPMFGIGLMLLLLSLRREIGRYMKNETVPVINEASAELTPAIRAVTNAVEGKKQCLHCGAFVAEGNAFCPACGKPLTKTCPHCGNIQPEENAYCGKCGEKL